MSTVATLGITSTDNPFHALAVTHAAMHEGSEFNKAAGCHVPAISRKDADIALGHAEQVLDDCTFGMQALGHLLRHHDGRLIGDTEDTLFQAGCLISLLANVQGHAVESIESARCRLWAHDRIAATLRQEARS